MSSETVTVPALTPTCLTCRRFPAPCAATRSASPHLYARVAGANTVPASMTTLMTMTITSCQPVPQLLQTKCKSYIGCNDNHSFLMHLFRSPRGN